MGTATLERARPAHVMGDTATAVRVIGWADCALAVNCGLPFARTCQREIDRSLGERRRAWLTVLHDGPAATRDALGAHGVLTPTQARHPWRAAHAA